MLKNLDALGLLKIQENKNVLENVPLIVKTPLVDVVVKYFTNQYDEAIKTCITEEHVHFYFEIFGTAFQLPRTEYQLMSATLEIYRKFLFEDTNRPVPLSQNFQYFVKEMFSHFSCLFQYETEKNEVALKEYILLCNQVLDLFLQVGRRGKLIELDTFVFLMKTLLGIADTVCAKDGLRRLSAIVVKTLYEFWICSMNCDIKLWQEFQKISVTWKENVQFILQWCAITHAFTQRLINYLYGPLVGEDCVRIEWKGLNRENNPNLSLGHYTTELFLRTDYTYFLWRILFFNMGNPNDIKDPKIYQIAMDGVKNICVTFAELEKGVDFKLMKKDELKMIYAPDTESILRFSGNWLFQAVNMEKIHDYVDGVAIAFETLCRIFCRKGGSSPTSENLSLFYDSIKNGLKSEEVKIKNAILLNSREIFSMDLDGVNVLLNAYTSTCEKILCGNASEYGPEIRRACITIFSTLIGLANHFGDQVYKSIKLQLQRNFAKSLTFERNERNIQQLLWCICVTVFEEIDKSKKVGTMFISTMLKICKDYATHPNSQYTPAVFGTLYNVLGTFSVIWEKIHQTNPQIIHKLLSLLSEQIEGQCRLLRQAPSSYYQFIIQSIECIKDYCVHAYSIIMGDVDLLGKILRAVQHGLNLKKMMNQSNQRELEKVYRASLYLLQVITMIGGNFPGIDDAAVFYSILNEEDLLPDQKSVFNSDYVRHYIFSNKYLFTMIEQPDEEGTHGCTIVCRNEMGKFTYDCVNLISEKPVPMIDLQERGYYKGSSSNGLIGHTKEDQENITLMKNVIGENSGFALAEKNLDKITAIIKQVEDMQEKKRNIEIPKLKNLDLCVQEDPVPDKYATENKFQMSRLLLSHLGYFHVGVDTFFQIVQSDEFEKFKKELGETFPRECNATNIMYLKNGDDDPKVFVANNLVSSKFKRFVDSVGWAIIGGGDEFRFYGNIPKEDTIHCPYYADYKSENVFHVFPNISNMNVKKDCQEVNRVNIIWSEHSREFVPTSIQNENNQINILVYPTKRGLFRIKIFTESLQNVPIFGPLLDGMLVSERTLAMLTTFTSYNANMALKNIDLRYVSPDKNRLMKIEKISKKLKRGYTFDNLLAKAFIPHQEKKEKLPQKPRKQKTSVGKKNDIKM